MRKGGTAQQIGLGHDGQACRRKQNRGDGATDQYHQPAKNKTPRLPTPTETVNQRREHGQWKRRTVGRTVGVDTSKDPGESAEN